MAEREDALLERIGLRVAEGNRPVTRSMLLSWLGAVIMVGGVLWGAASMAAGKISREDHDRTQETTRRALRDLGKQVDEIENAVVRLAGQVEILLEQAKE